MKKIIFTLTLILGFISAQANFDNYGPDSLCSVTIDTIQNGACLQALPNGTAPFTYEWSDSTTNSSTCIVPFFNTYCVTITDATGCQAVACSNNNVPNCTVSIDVIPDSSGYTITANSSGTPGFTYLWSNGNSTSQSIYTSVSGTFCVTVTDANGCSESACVTVLVNTPSCSVSISPILGTTCLEANPTGVAPYTYFWSDGSTASTYCSNSAPTDSLCVTITDNNGCVATACTLFGNGSDCDVEINQNGDDLIANATSNNPNQVVTYSWSTGELTQVISPLVDGNYCVTINDGNGCEASDCFYFYADTSGFCSVYIVETNSGLQAIASGDSSQTFTYLWSNGANTESIVTAGSGTYCVTITDASGCTASSCFTVLAMDLIEGYIFLDSISIGGGWINNGVNTFKIYLIEHDDIAGTLTAIDSMIVTSTPNNWGAFYSFTGLADGDYLVKAAIEVGSDQYDNYLPTYYGDVLYWNEATTVVVPGNNSFNNINMVAGTNPGGPGFIGGLISEGANFTSGQVETRGEGDPLENVSVLLLTENDVPITHTLTDDQGMFEFPNLAWGTYKVVVEVLGKEQGIKFITIGPNNPNGTINFEVNETFVTKIEDVLNGASLKVFPNPVDDNMNVQIEVRKNTNLNISVNTLLGETVITDNKDLNEGIQTININLKNLPTGIYFLNLSDGQEIISHKIMKR